MHPFESPMMNGLGATVPIPMAAMQGLGNANGTTAIEPVIKGVSGPMHIVLGVVVGLGAGWFLWKK